jgi:hypothetical protein
MIIMTGQDVHQEGQPGQHRAGHRTQLPDMTEGERVRNAKLVFRARVVVDARGSGIHLRPERRAARGGVE